MVDFSEIVYLIKDPELKDHAKQLQADALNRTMACIRDYANTRMQAVERGAETPAFAALLFEKYALGLIESAKIIGLVTSALSDYASQTIIGIDKDFSTNVQSRYLAKPAYIGNVEKFGSQ